jgi:hypothetical protein
LERLVNIIQNPTQFKIPTWFLNRQRDIVDGKNSQILSNGVDSKLREDLERLKKIRAHRGLRHFWGLRVRGQHTKTTGMLQPPPLLTVLTSFRAAWQDCWCFEEKVTPPLLAALGNVYYSYFTKQAPEMDISSIQDTKRRNVFLPQSTPR